jgi:hypothetical protein
MRSEIADDLRVPPSRNQYCSSHQLPSPTATHLRRGDPILHGLLHRIPLQPPYDQIRVPRPNINEQVEDRNFKLIRYHPTIPTSAGLSSRKIRTRLHSQV